LIFSLIKWIKFLNLVYIKKTHILREQLKNENNQFIRNYFTLEILEIEEQYSEWIKIFSLDMKEKFIIKHLNKYFYFSKKCYDLKLFTETLSAAKALISRNILSNEESEKVFRIWCRSAFELKDNAEISSCITLVKNKGYPPESPLLKWYSNYISEQ